MTSTGSPVRNTSVTISGGHLQAPVTITTGSLGNYVFQGMQSGFTCGLRVSAKRYRIPITPVTVTPSGDPVNVHFVANPRK